MEINKGIKVYEQNLKSFGIGKYKQPLRAIFQKKTFHAFCLGTPKSGTHSIANMFNDFRSCHEPNEVFMINLINKKIKGELSNSELIKILKMRDVSNWLGWSLRIT